MRPKSLVRDEEIYADLTAPFYASFPALCEMVIWTGVLWGAIGVIDRPAPIPAFLLERGIGTPNLHNLLVGLWIVVFLVRFVLPVLWSRGQRLIISHRRIIYRSKHRDISHDIDLNYVSQVHRQGRRLHVFVQGSNQPVVLERVPKAKKVEALISELSAGEQY
ncbi:MAG: hypothetical protein Q3972_00900 [Corynebacterium sp.]|nr:hypothetical protein [Corynebacterium sp.]